jgi:hypothetical protein
VILSLTLVAPVRKRSRLLPCQLLSLMLFGAAEAQYTFDPAAHDDNGIRYFGSAKDSDGALLKGVVILIDSGWNSYVLVTDEVGRFKVTLPLGTVPEATAVKCSKVGYYFVRVIKRVEIKPSRLSVQVDCLLRKTGGL